MGSRVFFADLSGERGGILRRIEGLLEAMEVQKGVREGDLCAIKVHFGERGNASFLRPLFLRPIVRKLRDLGAKPFLTDTNTLYKGGRSDAVSHLETALEHGFGYEAVGAPVLIADGLRGNASVEVQIEGEIYHKVDIAHAIHQADSLIVVTHFKGHDLAGFGGALKNLGMGCASRRGKLSQHSEVAPEVRRKRCRGCGRCVERCPTGALSLEGGKVILDEGRCIGCGECIALCPYKAIVVQWKTDPALFQRKMAEYALGAVKGKEGRVFFLNFLLQITPLCDCYPSSDPPLVGDIGVLASKDPVAIDQASVDLVIGQPANPLSSLVKGLGPGTDKFRAVHKGIDWQVQLEHAQRLGLGSRRYELVRV